MKLTYNDRKHAYWLDGKRCKGVTTVAAMPDDKYAIDKWRARQVVIGMATTPVLARRAIAHHDERDKLDDIAEEAMVAAKAHDAAGLGTAAHRITERVDLGLDWIDTPETRAIRDAWHTALDQAGLEVVPELVERIVVYPNQLVAGRFDRIARDKSNGRLVLLDVKTGENAIRYPHSTSVQLALYANAPLMAGPIPTEGGSTEQFEPLPDDVDRDKAVVVYLPAEGTPDVYQIDIAAGWDTARTICFPIIEWRRRNGLATKLATTTPAVRVVERPAPGDATTVAVASPSRTAWIRNRITRLTGHLDEIAANWPAGVPTLKQGGLTDDHINQIVTILDRIEADHQIPFGPTDPLFAPFTQADGTSPTEPATPALEPPDPRAEARRWTDKAKALLAEFDQTEQDAIIRLVVPEHAETTETHCQWIAAVVDELADPNGAVIFTYTTLGPEIVATNAQDRVRRGAGGTKTGALSRAKNLAKALGHPAPRVFDHVCTSPALAALTAAGLGTADSNTNPSSDEKGLT